MSSKNTGVTAHELAEALKSSVASGEKPADAWNAFQSQLKSLGADELAGGIAELDAAAAPLPDEVRWVDQSVYSVITEVDTGAREGPDWKFERFLAEPAPVFRLARTAGYDLNNGVEPWLHFAARRQIRHWYFENLRYRSTDDLRKVFSDDYFMNSTGATLSWIDAGNEECRQLFSRTASWRHWKTLRFEWLRSDDKTAFERWVGMLAETSLQNLSLQSCNPGEQGFRALANNPVMAGLEEIGLMNVVLGNHECDLLLAGSYQPRRLKKLRLDDCSLSNGKPEMDGEAFVRLIRSPYFACLEDLENHYHEIGANGIAALLQSPSRTTLKYLSLHNSRLKDEGLKLIFDNAWPSLREIYISYDHFSPEVMKSLRQTRLYAQCKQVSIFPMDGESIYKEKEIAQV